MGLGARGFILRMVACSLLFDAFVPLSPFIAKDLSSSDAAMESFLGMGMLVFAFAQYLSVPIVQRWGIQRSHAISAFLVGALAMLLTVAHGSMAFATLLVLAFAVNGAGATAGRVGLRNAGSRTEFQRLTAVANAAMDILAVGAPSVVMALAATQGWRVACAGLSGGLMVVSAMLILDTRRVGDFPVESGAKPEAIEGLLRDPRFIQASLLAIMLQGPFSAMMIAKPAILLDGFKLPPGVVGPLISGVAAATTGGFLFSGKCVGRMREGSQLLAGISLQGLACGLLALSALHETTGPFFFVAACVASAWGFAFALPPLTARALDGPADRRAKASGLFGLFDAAGTGAIVILAGLMPGSGLARLAVTTGGCFLVGLLLVTTVKPFSRDIN